MPAHACPIVCRGTFIDNEKGFCISAKKAEVRLSTNSFISNLPFSSPFIMYTTCKYSIIYKNFSGRVILSGGFFQKVQNKKFS